MSPSTLWAGLTVNPRRVHPLCGPSQIVNPHGVRPHCGHEYLSLVGFIHFVDLVKQLTFVGSVHFVDMSIDPSWGPSTLWTLSNN